MARYSHEDFLIFLLLLCCVGIPAYSSLKKKLMFAGYIGAVECFALSSSLYLDEVELNKKCYSMTNYRFTSPPGRMNIRTADPSTVFSSCHINGFATKKFRYYNILTFLFKISTIFLFLSL